MKSLMLRNVLHSQTSRTRVKKADKISDVRDFLWSMLQIDIGIDDVYDIGNQDPPTLVLVLQTQEDRRILMENKSKLKNYRNSKDQKCYINEFTPTTVNARKRRERDIVEQNEAKPDEAKLKIEQVKGSLVIQGVPYKKMVQPPTPFEMLDISPERLTSIMAIQLTASKEVHQSHSTFQAFTTEAHTLQQVRDAYIKMKLCFPTARHIFCTFAIDYENPTHNDFADDDEPGAGRTILELLRKNGISNRAIFCNRYCGETKLKSDRFECYSRVTVDAYIKLGLDVIT